MAKKKSTRRSISLKGLTYERLKDYCDATGCSVSGYLEEVIAEKMDEAGIPVPLVLRKLPEDRVTKADEQKAAHFSF